MTPSEIGERTEAAVLAALVCAGKHVLLPFGGRRRYDLTYEEGGRLAKVQCKTGREQRGVIWFRITASAEVYLVRVGVRWASSYLLSYRTTFID